MNQSIEDLLGVSSGSDTQVASEKKQKKNPIAFSFLFFSDVQQHISNAEKYAFMTDITVFGDKNGFEAIYIPERHFYEFGSIYANSAVMAAYLIPQTERIRFRTAGVSVPLHHPAEIVEWWAMNDILSNGRVDLGFGSGWNKPDFIYAPDSYEDRRMICGDRIPIIQQLWRGETVSFPGPGGEQFPIKVHPRPIQKELNVWLLVTQNDEGFLHAGRQGYNVFTMLYGRNFKAMEQKIAIYKQGRAEAGLDPEGGTVTLMLHTLLHHDLELVKKAVEVSFKSYIRSALEAHVKAAADARHEGVRLTEDERKKMTEYAYQRYFKTAAVFGTVDDGLSVVEEAIGIGVDEIACVVDFGVDYSIVRESLGYLKELVSNYI